MPNSLKILLSICFLISATACGGGGSGGGTRNVAPTVSNTSPDVIDERTEATLSVAASDPDGSIREYRWLQNSGPRVSFTNGRDNITFQVPEVDEDTPMTFFVDVVDDFGAITSINVEVTIRNVNRAPIADSQQLTVDENSFVEFNLTATDPDNDDLTFSITAQPTAGTLEQLDDTTQFYRYTPNADSLVDDQISFSVSDSELSDSATISFDVVVPGTKSLRLTAFSLPTDWTGQRWIELTNIGDRSLSLKQFELRTNELLATHFKPNNEFSTRLPDRMIKSGQSLTIVFSGSDYNLNQIYTPSEKLLLTLNNQSNARPFWSQNGFIEIYNRDYMLTADFVRFGKATQEPLSDLQEITTVLLPVAGYQFMQFSPELSIWFGVR